MLQFFAHEGHDHSLDSHVSDSITSEFFSSIYGMIFINLAPFVLLALLIFTLRKLFKLRQSLQLALILVYLLLVGLLGYQTMPVASIISLVGGFGLSLALVVLPFKNLKR